MKKTTTPFFSIIVPIYQVEQYLKVCVDSLLGQTFTNFELILVDDGSPDSCPDICDKYAQKDSHVYVIHKPNGGLSDARNAGMEHARGQYITFVDGDDFWNTTDVLSYIHQLIISNNFPDVIACDFIKYFSIGEKYILPHTVSTEILNGRDKDDILKYLYLDQADMKISACQKFVRRELVIDNPFEKGLLSEDIDWSFRIYTQMKSICICSKPFYCYRQMRAGSITNTASTRSFDSIAYIIDKWSGMIPQLKISKSEKDILTGYLAYQLSIMMLIYNNLSHEYRHQALKTLKRHICLFDGLLNKKTRKVKALIRFVGMKYACIVLNRLYSLRTALQRMCKLSFA